MAAYRNVEKIRAAKGVTKTFLARKLGMSLQGYSHIANGHTRLDVERLHKIALALDIQSAVFLDDELTDFVIGSLGRKGAEQGAAAKI